MLIEQPPAADGTPGTAFPTIRRVTEIGPVYLILPSLYGNWMAKSNPIPVIVPKARTNVRGFLWKREKNSWIQKYT